MAPKTPEYLARCFLLIDEPSNDNSLNLFNISSFLELVLITRWVVGLASMDKFSNPVLRRSDALRSIG